MRKGGIGSVVTRQGVTRERGYGQPDLIVHLHKREIRHFTLLHQATVHTRKRPSIFKRVLAIYGLLHDPFVRPPSPHRLKRHAIRAPIHRTLRVPRSIPVHTELLDFPPPPRRHGLRIGPQPFPPLDTTTAGGKALFGVMGGSSPSLNDR